MTAYFFVFRIVTSDKVTSEKKRKKQKKQQKIKKVQKNKIYGIKQRKRERK
jgi:hypothetical protein